MRESNLYKYEISLLALLSRDLIPRFKLCQFDETFNVFYLCIKSGQTFCADYFARSLPASTLAAK